MSKCYKLPMQAKCWYDHQPLPVAENDSVKVLWDFCLRTDIHEPSNRLDIVVFLKQEQRISADITVLIKEQDKLTKYHVRFLSVMVSLLILCL